ncbi:MAG: cupredoxin domain-containing protein [Patescibacteria group bacterium]
MKNTVVVSLIVLAVIGVLVYSSMSKKPAETKVEETKDASMVKDTPSIKSENGMMAENVLTVEGSNFKFVPDTLTVKKGQKTRLVFKNMQGMHDFKVDELGIKTEILKTGGEQSVEFTADKSGTFEFYCSVGSHRAMGMKGTLVVEE